MGARKKALQVIPDAADFARIERIRAQRNGAPSASAVALEALRFGLAAIEQAEASSKARRGGGRG